jgi:serine/threonine protein kinase/anti-anti-sigma regulatory factor
MADDFSCIVATQGGESTVTVRGTITERSDFASIISRVADVVVIDLAEVTRINSLGVSNWIRFLHDLSPRDVILTRCAPVMVQQFYLMRNSRGPARIRSVLLPFCCARCHAETTHTLTIEDVASPHIPESVPCAACGGQMTFDDLAEMYLSPLLREEEDSLIGTVLEGGYEIVERVGVGGTSRVYRALQSRVLGRNVAVKVLSSSFLDNDAAVRRFENEARIIARLRHPNTVKLLDFGRLADGRLYLVTELMVGDTLENLLKLGPIGIDRTLKIMGQLCDSLAEAHSVEIVHRDLKPANIFLERIADQEFVKVLDFGTAKQLSAPGVTAPMVIFGTPAYMSPEQARGEQVDRRTDLYTLGAILYECLVGRPVFTGSSAFSLMLKHAFERPEPPRLDESEVSAELSKLVMRLLAKDPAARPQTTQGVRAHIDAIVRARMLAEARREASERATSSVQKRDIQEIRERDDPTDPRNIATVPDNDTGLGESPEVSDRTEAGTSDRGAPSEPPKTLDSNERLAIAANLEAAAKIDGARENKLGVAYIRESMAESGNPSDPDMRPTPDPDRLYAHEISALPRANKIPQAVLGTSMSHEVLVRAARDTHDPELPLYDQTEIKDENGIRTSLAAKQQIELLDDTLVRQQEQTPRVGVTVENISESRRPLPSVPTSPGVSAASAAPDPMKSASEERTLVELLGDKTLEAQVKPNVSSPSGPQLAVIPPPSFPSSSYPAARADNRSPKPTSTPAWSSRFPPPLPSAARSGPHAPLQFTPTSKSQPPLDDHPEERTPTPPIRRNLRLERQALLIALIGLMIAAVGIAWIFAFRPTH